MSEIFFMDMDSVLVDFDAGARALIEKLGLPQPPEDTDDLFPGSEYKEARDYITKNPKFWLDLPPNKDAVDAFLHTDAEVYVCSSPAWPGSASPKLEWCKKHLGVKSDRVVLTCSKYLLAGPDKVLVDDQLKYCNPFVRAGGYAILIEYPWSYSNPDEPEPEDGVAVLKLPALPYVMCGFPF